MNLGYLFLLLSIFICTFAAAVKLPCQGSMRVYFILTSGLSLKVSDALVSDQKLMPFLSGYQERLYLVFSAIWQMLAR